MKKTEFIKKVLEHDLNTIFVEPQLVDRAIEIFENLGMSPPEWEVKTYFDKFGCKVTKESVEWEPEDE